MSYPGNYQTGITPDENWTYPEEQIQTTAFTSNSSQPQVTDNYLNYTAPQQNYTPTYPPPVTNFNVPPPSITYPPVNNYNNYSSDPLESLPCPNYPPPVLPTTQYTNPLPDSSNLFQVPYPPGTEPYSLVKENKVSTESHHKRRRSRSRSRSFSPPRRRRYSKSRWFTTLYFSSLYCNFFMEL
jgi:hypothetical protein